VVILAKSKTVFTSDEGYDEAKMKANMKGYRVIGKSRNKKGEYVVFARKFQVI